MHTLAKHVKQVAPGHLASLEKLWYPLINNGKHLDCNCAIMLVVLELLVCTSWGGEVHIQTDLQYKHKHKHESHMTAQTSRHTIQAQAQT